MKIMYSDTYDDDATRRYCCWPQCFSPPPSPVPMTIRRAPGLTVWRRSMAWFAEEVWAKVGVMECIKCHKQGGDAEDTRLILHDPGLTRVTSGES